MELINTSGAQWGFSGGAARGGPSPIFLLMAALTVLTALIFDQFGFTWDETKGLNRAIEVYDFLASGGRHTADISQFSVVHMYGAMPDVLALVLQKLVPALSYDSRHLVSALFGLTGIFYTYRLGALLVSARTGLIAALFLACNPMWFGNMFLNLKDIPFAATLIVAVYYCIIALIDRAPARSTWFKVGLSIGLLSTTKLLGIIVLGFLMLLMIASMVLSPSTVSLKIDKQLSARIALTAGAGSLGCLVCFVLFWPEFFFFGMSNFTVLRSFMNFTDWQGAVLLNSHLYSPDQAPWYFTTIYLLIAMPFVLVVLTAIGFILGVLRRQPMVMASAAFCFCAIAEQAGAIAYSGYRHFLFLEPFLALIAAYPAAILLEVKGLRLFRFTAGAFIALALLWTITQMYRLHPYEYSYYNLLVGGLLGADGRFYVDVWHASGRDVLKEIDKLPDAPPEIRVYSCADPLNAADLPRIQLVKPTDADYRVDFRRRCSNEDLSKLPVIAEVRRLGVVLARVYGVK